MENTKYVREITPETLRCIGGIACPAVYEAVEITPEEMRCSPLPICPGIYELKRQTPEEMQCGVGACPEVYEKGEEYFFVGKAVNRDEAEQIKIEEGKSLADKVGEGEVLVKILRNLVNASVLKSLSERIAKHK